MVGLFTFICKPIVFLHGKSKKTYSFFLIVVGLCILGMIGCNQNSRLDTKTFRDILFRIHECEAYHEIKFNNQNPAFLESCKESIFQETKVDSAMFYKTLEYYKQHSSEFEVLYDTLIQASEAKPI